ncbi:SsgA family sporulation/cell division regulator [Amycolatopsis sp. NBC_01307]|uniref:SsgA family sporulation/cell division regulator n=1 Tax=Amycolatopsis sp. NBC_01307 TaxID=2903561 RepID=UPI002E15A59C|nr:SsgA family sporulation/cell division regulator [Amycolatopsis sp. NBC_01307]
MTLTFPETGVLLGSNTKLGLELGYDIADPWAVTLTAAGQVWLFARDLLASGCNEPTGDGDVQVRPDTGGVFARVVIALSSPDGAAEIAVPRGTVESFLAAADAVVPAGHEDIDWPTELARLSGGTAA